MALFVLGLAAINFMNLSTARSSNRSKEVGLRKSIGASKGQIVAQFLSESIIMAFFAMVIGVILAFIFIPYINQVTSRPLSLIEHFQQPLFLLGLFIITLCIGILSGIYPAFVVSSFNPIRVLKGQMGKVMGKTTLQNFLVVGQFTVAISLMIGTFIAIQQFQFMKSKDIGFDKEHIVLIPMSRSANNNYETLKNELLRKKGVQGVTASGQRIGNNFHRQ